MDKLYYRELSYQIIGILFKVHRELGAMLQEKFYQRAVEKEFEKQNIIYEKEFTVPVFYGKEKIGLERLDFLVEDKIVLELKAVRYLNPQFFKQVSAYLAATDKKLAIIANFRNNSLEFHRVLNPKFAQIKQ
ncbi:MAG: GxxExxY protein [Candidatus Cloacimonetes bacterium]|nr:GxxExxY protein [Candidatus Cloacimonadota bacterium]